MPIHGITDYYIITRRTVNRDKEWTQKKPQAAQFRDKSPKKNLLELFYKLSWSDIIPNSVHTEFP